MADEIDQACEREQRDREMCIAAARVIAKTRELPAVGLCYNCHEPVAEGSRYCPGPDCRDDHQARKRAEIRAGGQ